MSSRTTNRFLTMLLFVLAAFRFAWSGFAVARCIRLIVAQVEQGLPHIFVCRWCFQRPPPAILLSYA